MGLFVLTGYWMINRPTHNRNWQPEFATWPIVDFHANDTVTIKGIRDWRFNQDEPTSSQYIDRTYEIDDLVKVWFIIEPFGGYDGIAHTMLSFEFISQPPVVISLEARKEIGESYSPLKGLFNQYELLYMWGTEADFFGRRAVMLDNQLYMYPLEISDQGAKQIFITLLEQTDEHRRQPSFYNTLTANCTNMLAYSANRVKPGTIPRFAKARYLTGYSDDLLYQQSMIPHDQPLEVIQNRYNITEFTQQSHTNRNFSTMLRQYLTSDIDQ